ncbi:nucleoporin Nup186/Nup192/Nup205 [Neocallimastix sp. 'constans']
MAVDAYFIINSRKIYNKLCDISQDENNVENLKIFLDDNHSFFINVLEKRKPNQNHKDLIQSGQIKLDNENFRINERFIFNTFILSTVLNIDENLAAALLYQSIKNNNVNLSSNSHHPKASSGINIDKNKNNEKSILLSAFHSYYTNRYYILLSWKFILSGLIENKFEKTVHEVFTKFTNEIFNSLNINNSAVSSESNSDNDIASNEIINKRPISLMIDYIREISEPFEKVNLDITEEQESYYIYLLSKKETIILYEKKLMIVILVQLFNLQIANAQDAMDIIQQIAVEDDNNMVNNLLSMILEYLQLPVDNVDDNSLVHNNNNNIKDINNLEDELRNTKNDYLLNIEFVQNFNNVVLNKDLWKIDNLGIRAIILIQWAQQFQRYPYIAKKYGMTKEKLDILLNEAFKTPNFLRTLKNYMYLPKRYNTSKHSTSTINFMELAVPNSPFTPMVHEGQSFFDDEYVSSENVNNNIEFSITGEMASSSSLYLDTDKNSNDENDSVSNMIEQQNDDDLDQFKFLEIQQFFELLIKYNSNLIISVNDDSKQLSNHENIIYLLSRFIGSNMDYGFRFWKIDYLYNFIVKSINIYINGDKSIYVNFLAALATGKSCAQIAYDYLIMNEFISLNDTTHDSVHLNHFKFNWNIIFVSLNEFIIKVQNHPNISIVNSDLNLLKSLLRLIRQIAHYSIQARTTLYENPKYQAVNHLFNLLCCKLESLGDYVKISLHASIFRTISAFCLPINGKHIDITRQVWLMLEQSQFLKSSVKMSNIQQSNYYLIQRKNIYQNYVQNFNNQYLIKWKSFNDHEFCSKSNFSVSSINTSQTSLQLANNMLYELEEVESSIGVYSETIAFMNLISILSQNLQSYGSYDKKLNNLSSIDYVNYIINDIFMKVFERDYKYSYQKWEIIESSLRIFNQWFNSFNIEGSFINKEMIQNIKNYTKSKMDEEESDNIGDDQHNDKNNYLNKKSEHIFNVDENEGTNIVKEFSSLSMSNKSISESSINEEAEAINNISLLNLALHPGCQMMCKILEGSEFLTSILKILYFQNFKEDSDNLNDRLISHLKSQSIEHVLQLLLTVLNIQDTFLGLLIPQINSFDLPYTIPEVMTHLDEFLAYCPEIIINLSLLINNSINDNISIYVSKILLNLSLSPYFQENNILQLEEENETTVHQKCKSLANILSSSDKSNEILNGFIKAIKHYEIENPIQLPYYYSGLDIFGRFLTENVYDSKTVEDIMNLLGIHDLEELPIVGNTLQSTVFSLLLNNQLSNDSQPKLAPLANYILGIILKKNNNFRKNKISPIKAIKSNNIKEDDDDYNNDDDDDDDDESENGFLEDGTYGQNINIKNINNNEYIKDGGFKELLEVLKNEINMPVHKNPYLNEKACEVIYRLCASKDTEKIILNYLRFDENLNAIQLKSLPLKNHFDGVVVDTVLKSENEDKRQYPSQLDFTNNIVTNYLSKASIFISQLIRQKWIMKTVALDLHTIKNQDSYKHYIQQLMKLLLQQIVNHDNNNVSNRLISILSSIDNIPKETVPLEFKDKTKLFYLKKIDYDKFVQSTSQDVKVYDITRIYSMMEIYLIYLEKHNIITTQSQKDMYYLEMRQVLEHLFAINHSHEMVSAQYNYIKSWIEIVETVYLKCNKFMTHDQRTIVLHTIIVELLNRAILEQNQDFVLLYVKTSVTLTVQLLNNTAEIDTILKETSSKETKRKHPLAIQLILLLLRFFTNVRKGKSFNDVHKEVNETIRGYLYTLLIKCMDYIMMNGIQYTGDHEELETVSSKDIKQLVNESKQIEFYKDENDDNSLNIKLKMLYKYFRLLMETVTYDIFKVQTVWRITAYSLITKLCKFSKIVYGEDYVLKFIKENNIMHLIIKDFNEKSMIDSLHDIIQNDNPISLNALYLYESKMALLLCLSETIDGITLLLNNTLLETFAKFSFLNLKPEYEQLNIDIGTFIPSLRERYHQLLYPILQILVRISSLNNYQENSDIVYKEQFIQRYNNYMKKIAQFIQIYEDIIMIIMKDQIITLKSMKELELLTALFTYLTDYKQLLTDILPGPGNNSFHTLIINIYQKYSIIYKWLPYLRPINEIEKYLSYQPIQIASNQYIQSVYQWEAYQLRNKICMNTIKYLYLISTNKSIWNLISKDDYINITPVFIYENNIVTHNRYDIKRLPTIYNLLCGINENLDTLLNTSSDIRELSDKLAVYQTNKSINYNKQMQEIQFGLENLIKLKSDEISTYLYIIEHSFTLLWSHLSYYKEMDKKKWKYFMDEVNPSIQISMSAVILNTLNKLKQFVMPIEISNILPNDTTNYQKFAQVISNVIKDLLIK